MWGDAKVNNQRTLAQAHRQCIRRAPQGLARTLSKSGKGLDELAIGDPGKKPIPSHMSPEFSTNSPPRTHLFLRCRNPDDLDRALSDDERQRRILGSFNHGSMATLCLRQSARKSHHPGRQVISLSGDGGIAMLLGDLLSLRQLKLPVKVIVFKNDAWRLWN